MNVPSDEQVKLLTEGLDAARRRFRNWLVVCLLFATSVLIVAIFTRSVLFLVVDGFAWFAAWNRWKCWTFVSALRPTVLPSNDEERVEWVNRVEEALTRPPSWLLRSEYVSGGILLLLFGVISFFVVTTSGLWMRLLYAVAWGCIILFVVWNAKYSRLKGIEAARPE